MSRQELAKNDPAITGTVTCEIFHKSCKDRLRTPPQGVEYSVAQTAQRISPVASSGAVPCAYQPNLWVGALMKDETSHSELIRLRKEQIKAQQNEVFGGWSPAEHAQYEQRMKRINELEIQLRMTGISEKNSESGAEQKQRSRWNEESETDTHQSEAHQPYRSREERPSMETDPDFRNSAGRKSRKEPEEKGGE
jgi:hypothetical protein